MSYKHPTQNDFVVKTRNMWEIVRSVFNSLAFCWGAGQNVPNMFK